MHNASHVVLPIPYLNALWSQVKFFCFVLTESTRVVVALSPSDLVSDFTFSTVMDVLCQKHPP